MVRLRVKPVESLEYFEFDFNPKMVRLRAIQEIEDI